LNCPVSASWSQVGNSINGEAPWDRSGYSISLSADGKTVAIGAHKNDGINGNDTGHVRVYDWDGAQWSQRGTDIDGEAPNDWSGWSISLSKDATTVAIGAHYNDSHSGHVRIYKWIGNAWTQAGQDIDGKASDFAGWSVSLSLEMAIELLLAPLVFTLEMLLDVLAFMTWEKEMSGPSLGMILKVRVLVIDLEGRFLFHVMAIPLLLVLLIMMATVIIQATFACMTGMEMSGYNVEVILTVKLLMIVLAMEFRSLRTEIQWL
jgi:hypothetical protein